MNCFLLLAQGNEAHRWFETFAKPEVLMMLIPLAAVVGSFAFGITTAILRHRERIAKIQNGIDPDAKPPKG